MDAATAILGGTLIAGFAVPITGWILTRGPKFPANGNSPVTKSQCAKQHVDLEKLINEKFDHVNEKIDLLISR
jgi:hypothetical protein